MSHITTAEDRLAAHRAASKGNLALDQLRAAGIGVEKLEEHRYLVAGTILFWPHTGYWRMQKGPAFGYGVDKLIAAILPAAEPHRPSLALVPPVTI